MDTTILKSIFCCEVCNQIKEPRHARDRINIPQRPTFPPWDGVTMDFVTNLPKSMSLGFTGILVVVDQLTKMPIYLHRRTEIGSPELPQMCFEHVICKYCVLEDIITDCGTQFNSRFWTPFCSHMSIDQRLLTAFQPQTDGQTEHHNQIMEQYLRALGNYKQESWIELLPLAEFAYNNCVHASTLMTPF